MEHLANLEVRKRKLENEIDELQELLHEFSPLPQRYVLNKGIRKRKQQITKINEQLNSER